MISINAKDGRLSIIGYQPEVKRIYWSALPNTLPTFGQTLDLTGCEIKAIYADGSEAVVTDFCTFSPDTGYLVPNEQTLTVTATYTARSGKVCEADEVLPICTIDHIKIIIPHSVPENIKDRQFKWSSGTPTFSDYAEAFGFKDVYVAAYWVRNSELVQVTRLNNDEVLGGNFWYYAGDEGVGPMIQSRSYFYNGATYERFYTPLDSEEVEYQYAHKLTATFTYSGETYTDKAYLTADGFIGFTLLDAPSSYTGTEYLTLSARSSTDWNLIYSESGEQPMSLFYPYIDDLEYYDRGTRISIHVSSHTYVEVVDRIYGDQGYGVKATLTDNATDKFVMGTSATYPQTTVTFDCSAGTVDWTYQHKAPTTQPI